MEAEDSTETVLRLQRSLQKFIDTVDNLDCEDDPSGDGFTREFRVLRELGLKMREENTHPAQEGRKPHNIKKNRYKDILPFDETRVVLEEIGEEPGSDYINANFIRGYNGCETYIATQGPLPATVNDFWRMIWQYNVKVITMACRLVEMGKRKCEQYWPPEVKETQAFGNVIVTLVSEEDFAEHCTKRVMSVKKDGETRQVIQFQYTGWPDHDIPDDIEDILEMMALLRNIKAEDTSVPVVIHCSAGCGRTGTICAIDYAWDELKSGRLTEDFSLYSIVKEMREQRQSMIQAPEQYKCAHVAIRIFFEKHQQLMEDHTYGNFNFGNNEDEEESGYADPKSVGMMRKVSAMADDIERTIKQLTQNRLTEDNVGDPTPLLIPQLASPVTHAPPPPTQSEPAKPAPFVKPELARKPSIENPPAKEKPPSPSVKHAVFAIEKLENVPASKGNPAQKVVQGSTAVKHDINLNKQGVIQANSNQGIEAKRPSVKATKAVYEPNNNVAVKSQAPVQTRPVLHRVESKQSDDNRFKTVISIGGASGSKPAVGKTVSNPMQDSVTAGQNPIQKSKTMPSRVLPAFYEAPQSSVPPSTPTQTMGGVYSFASEPGSSAYSSLSTYSSLKGPGQPSLMQTGVDVVSPVEYNGVTEAGDRPAQTEADMYAVVNRPQAVQKASENVYESVAVGPSKTSTGHFGQATPPVPDRNYAEDEKNTAFEKPGSSEQLNTLGKKGKLDTLKQIFSGGRGSGSGSSDQVATSGVPGFKVRLGQNPKGPRQQPMIWKATTKM